MECRNDGPYRLMWTRPFGELSCSISFMIRGNSEGNTKCIPTLYVVSNSTLQHIFQQLAWDGVKNAVPREKSVDCLTAQSTELFEFSGDDRSNGKMKIYMFLVLRVNRSSILKLIQ